jgi:chromosome segregation ATPase
MSDIEKFEATIRELEAKHAAAVARAQEIAEQRKTIGFRVHADGDAKAREQLEALNADAAALAGETESLTGAIAEATRRLVAARQAAAREEDRKAALALREVAGKIGDRMRRADKYFAAAIEELNSASCELTEIHRLGSEFPTSIQVAVNASLALKSYLMQLPAPWQRDFVEHLAPHLRTILGRDAGADRDKHRAPPRPGRGRAFR